jgi:hypothetical protein
LFDETCLQALKYLESDPILWIRSRVWFRFLSLRLIALNQLQLQLFRLKPPNYGILTSINMHLIRSTLITPICTTGYLQEALYSLHFNAERTTLTQRFGMFFLHTLDYDTGYIPEIEDEDTPETDRVMGLNKKRKAKKSAPLQIAEADIDPDTYPLGLSPAWFEIVKMLEDNPGSLIRPWIASQELPAVSMKAAELFIGMTNDLTRHSLNPAHLKSKLTLQISTIEDAMQFWTVESFQTHFLSCQFKASNFGLRGARTGPAQSSFQDMAIIFFPPLQTVFNPSSVWGPFSRQGYISIYHKELQRRSLEKQDELFQELNAIFRRLQCLPVASACGSGARQQGKLWTTSDGAIEVNTNPRFYRLREIGDPVKAKRRVALRIKYTNKVIESRLIAGYKGIPIQLSRRIAKLQDKAGQAKMKRQPPLNRWQKRKRDDLDDDLNDSDGQGCEDHMEIEKEDNWNDALDDTESDEDRDEDEGRYESWDEDEDEDDVT